MNYQQIMEELLRLIKEKNSNSIIGYLPPVGGIAIMLGGGTSSVDMAGNVFMQLRIKVSSKAETQNEAVAMIDEAHGVLIRNKIDGDNWHIYSGHILPATVMGQDAQKMWIVSSDCTIKAVAERTE